MKTRIKTIIFLTALALTAIGCSVSFTTAKIESLNFGKNDKANPATTSFNVGEQVFAVANVTGAMGKNKMKIKMTPTGGSAVEKEVEFEGSKPITYSFTPSNPIEIKFEFSLLDDSGKEVDKKLGTITVKGSAAPPANASKDEDSDHGSEDNSHN